MERTCVACRRTGGPDDLVRLVADPEGRVVPDLSGRLPGRGAWTCPTEACVRKLEDRRALLARAFRADVDPAGLLDCLRAVARADLEDALGIAARSGCVRGGAETLARLGPGSRVVALVVAEDASTRSVAAAARRVPGVPLHRAPLAREVLGAVVGRGPRAVLAITAGAPSRRLLRVLRRREGLG